MIHTYLLKQKSGVQGTQVQKRPVTVMKIQDNINDEYILQKLLRDPTKGNFQPIKGQGFRSTLSRENWLDHKVCFRVSTKSEIQTDSAKGSNLKRTAVTSDGGNMNFLSFGQTRKTEELPEYIYVDSDQTFLLKLKIAGSGKQLETLKDRVRLIEMELDFLLSRIGQ